MRLSIRHLNSLVEPARMLRDSALHNWEMRHRRPSNTFGRLSLPLYQLMELFCQISGIGPHMTTCVMYLRPRIIDDCFGHLEGRPVCFAMDQIMAGGINYPHFDICHLSSGITWASSVALFTGKLPDDD